MQRRQRRSRRVVTNTVARVPTSAQLRRDEQGYVPRGSFDPPRVVANPWNSIVLAGESAVATAGQTPFTFSNLQTLLASQIGLPATTVFVVRISRVDVWSGLSSTTALSGTIALRAEAFGSGTSSYQWIEDRGTVARPGHVHFVWPRAQQAHPIATSVTGTIFTVDHISVAQWTQHVHILWRIDGGDPVPTSRRIVDLS